MSYLHRSAYRIHKAYSNTILFVSLQDQCWELKGTTCEVVLLSNGTCSDTFLVYHILTMPSRDAKSHRVVIWPALYNSAILPIVDSEK